MPQKQLSWKKLSPSSYTPHPNSHILLLSITSYAMRHPFGQLGSAVPAPSPPSILPTPRVLTEVAKWEREKALMLCKDCSSIAKTVICYQHWFGHQPKIQHCVDCHEENQPKFPLSAEPSTCWISSDFLHTPFNFQASPFVFFHRTKCANKQKHLSILSSGNRFFSPTYEDLDV